MASFNETTSVFLVNSVVETAWEILDMENVSLDSGDEWINISMFFNESINATTAGPLGARHDMSRIYAIMLPVIIAFCLLSGVVSCAVVCATPWVKRPMSPTVRLSLSLAAANTVFSVSVAVAVLINSYLPVVYHIHPGKCLGLSTEAVRMGSILVQILHLLAVALNHYMGTLRPLHYAATMTPATLKVILVALWVIPMAGMFIAFSSIPGQGFQSANCSQNYFYVNGITFRIVWSALFFGPTLLIILAYCHIFHLLNNRGLYLVSAEQRNQLRRNIKTVRTTALIVGTFVIGWGPAVVKFLLICDECPIKPHEIDFNTALASGATVNIIYCLKVFTDTFIYALRLRDIRKALQTMWVLLCHRLHGNQGHVANMSYRASSKFSYTASTRVSSGSPGLHRTRPSLTRKPLGLDSISDNQMHLASPNRYDQHQPSRYFYKWGYMYPNNASVFIAIDDCNLENGCLQVLRGSHKMGRVDHIPVGKQLTADPERVEEAKKRLDLIAVEMRAGDVLYFSSNLLHCSGPNESNSRRWSYVIAYNERSNLSYMTKGHLLYTPHPLYTPLVKVPNSNLMTCDGAITDQKWFMKAEEDKARD